jgi:hypothetical protein
MWASVELELGYFISLEQKFIFGVIIRLIQIIFREVRNNPSASSPRTTKSGEVWGVGRTLTLAVISPK